MEKTREGAPTIAAGKTKEGLSTLGEVITDEWITTGVHARFVDEDLLKASGISVDTDDHVVTLNGTLPRASRLAHDETTSRAVMGPRRVDV